MVDPLLDRALARTGRRRGPDIVGKREKGEGRGDWGWLSAPDYPVSTSGCVPRRRRQSKRKEIEGDR